MSEDGPVGKEGGDQDVIMKLARATTYEDVVVGCCYDSEIPPYENHASLFPTTTTTTTNSAFRPSIHEEHLTLVAPLLLDALELSTHCTKEVSFPTHSKKMSTTRHSHRGSRRGVNGCWC